jgi:hypothetical protein
VPDTNGEEWDRLDPCRGIDLLVSTAIEGEYGGLGVAAPTNKETMELRGIALSTFDVRLKSRDMTMLKCASPGICQG